ncbi:hypothetical protein DdX_15491 [Ditylenchus destructor]|uniref:Uncharacterized protein n=1 Tax=Ditylenchus destructor TaxID=166010 RepID=A0AAD4MUV2_9BILA|nr:hypothetical protein DdX_15491 [Ditylenchus destructor]
MKRRQTKEDDVPCFDWTEALPGEYQDELDPQAHSCKSNKYQSTKRGKRRPVDRPFLWPHLTLVDMIKCRRVCKLWKNSVDYHGILCIKSLSVSSVFPSNWPEECKSLTLDQIKRMLRRSAKYIEKVHLVGLISLKEAEIFDNKLLRRISAIPHLKSFTVSIPHPYLKLSTFVKLRNALPNTIRHLEICSLHREADWKALGRRRRRWHLQQRKRQSPPLDHQQLYEFVKHFPLLESFVFDCVPYTGSFKDLNLSSFLPQSTIRRIELLDNPFDGRQIGWLADNCPLLNFVRITVHTSIVLKDVQKLCTGLIL